MGQAASDTREGYMALKVDRGVSLLALALTVGTIAWTVYKVIIKKQILIAILLLVFGILGVFVVKHRRTGLVIVLLVKILPLVQLGTLMWDVYKRDVRKIGLGLIGLKYGKTTSKLLGSFEYSWWFVAFVVFHILVSTYVSKRGSFRKLVAFVVSKAMDDTLFEVIWTDFLVVVGLLATTLAVLLGALVYSGSFIFLTSLTIVVGVGYYILKDDILKMYYYEWGVSSVRDIHGYITASFAVHRGLIQWFPFLHQSGLAYLGFGWVDSGAFHWAVVFFDYGTYAVEKVYDGVVYAADGVYRGLRRTSDGVAYVALQVYYGVGGMFGVVREHPVAVAGVLAGVVGVAGIVVGVLGRERREHRQ